ncbi:tRNA adenosine(34) deaminase TadA [Alicyclobacillus fodiniaquatilis]|uniref:tRNA-specific adenosine deaminase n=1 Tax=Alicyclobacillus fodiniaquatilis TaxID=1661150 RepID=A0ABW4JEK6_9BACL
MQATDCDRTDEHWMRLALDEARKAAARGEVPIGAVVVRNGEVVGAGHNLRETWRDPTAHAELIALQAASRRLGAWRLTDCDIYVTLEPCPMCSGAIMLSRVRRLIFGATDVKGGAVISKIPLLEPGRWNHTPEIHAGVLTDECAYLLKDFFQNMRKQPKR